MGLLHRLPPRARQGFSLLEIYVTLSILSMMLAGLLQARESVRIVREVGDERVAAMNALLERVGELQRASDAAERGTGPWSVNLLAGVERTLPVDGLEPLPGRSAVGRVRVLTDEHVQHEELGLPRDMDGSGAVDSGDVSHTAERLPIVIELAWNGLAGPQELTRGFWLER